MKKLFYLGLALCALAFHSCDDRARLGKEISGVWSAPDNTLQGIPAVNAVTIDSYAFLPDSSFKSGELIITGMFNITFAPQAVAGFQQPVSTSVSGKSIARATYTVVDDDEIALNFKLDSVKVEIDPSEVNLTDNLITNADKVSTDTVSPNVAATLQATVRGALQARYAAMRFLDDVDVKGNMLKFEVADTEYRLLKETN